MGIKDRDQDSLKDIDYLKRFLTGEKKSGKLHKTSIVHDVVDRRQMDEAMKDVSEFRDTENRMAAKFDNGSALSADMWQAMHKADPIVRDEEEMDPESLMSREAAKEMMKLPEFEELRDFTVGDGIASGLATSTIAPKVEEIMGDLQERQDAVNELLQRIKDAEDNDGEGMPSQEEIDELLDSLGDGLGGMRQDLRDALKEASDEMKGMEGMSQMWGTDPGELKRMPAEERIKLARRIRDNPNLNRLADLIGAFQRFAAAMQHRKTNELQTDIYDIELGDDLDHVLPSELALLALEDTELEFARRFGDRALMQYRLQGREKVGKGGIVCCIDTSGSMGMERDVFAKAVGLSLYKIAKAQDRTMHGILFGSRNELQHYDLTNADPNGVLDFATFSFHGGTDFEAPLGMSMDILEQEHEHDGALKSDVVFITDGYCGVSEPFMERLTDFKERLGARIFGVTIGGDVESEPLKTICDGRVWPISNLNGPEDMKDIFQNI